MACAASLATRYLLAALSALTLPTGLSGASQDGPSCNAKPLLGKVVERGGADTYKSPNIEGGERLTIFSFPRRLDPLRGRRIVDQDPLHGVARLSDGSGLSFARDCRGVRCVYSGLKVSPRATDCWEWLSDDNLARGRTASGAFDLGDDRFISVDNSRGAGRLVVRTKTATWETLEEPLIVGPRSIVGFGVSVSVVDAPLRTIDVIRREKDGSLSLATYVYKYR